MLRSVLFVVLLTNSTFAVVVNGIDLDFDFTVTNQSGTTVTSSNLGVYVEHTGISDFERLHNTYSHGEVREQDGLTSLILRARFGDSSDATISFNHPTATAWSATWWTTPESAVGSFLSLTNDRKSERYIAGEGRSIDGVGTFPNLHDPIIFVPPGPSVLHLHSQSRFAPSVTSPGQSVETLYIMPHVAGDADLRGSVDFSDFLILSRNFGETVNGWAQGDFTLDKYVGFEDFLALSRNYGQRSGLGRAVLAVPEPSFGIIWIVVALLATLRK